MWNIACGIIGGSGSGGGGGDDVSGRVVNTVTVLYTFFIVFFFKKIKLFTEIPFFFLVSSTGWCNVQNK